MARISREVAPGIRITSLSAAYDLFPFSKLIAIARPTLLRGIRACRPAGSEQFIETIERLTGRDLITKRDVGMNMHRKKLVFCPRNPDDCLTRGLRLMSKTLALQAR